jgi:hypothetical protein
MPGFVFLFLSGEIHAQVVRPIPIPGRIEAENYDTNGPGISYYDTTSGNSGGAYRNDDVDMEPTTDIGGGYDVGWIASGEWLNYTLNVQATAIYQLAFRVASASGPGDIQVSLDGLPLCTVVTPFTGGWQSWQTVTISNIAIQAGQRLLHIEFQAGGQNLNYIEVTKQGDLVGGFLRASGKQIVDGQGQNLILRGMGLGNWMLQEPYMMDVSGIVENQQQLKIKITELVGADNMAVFYSAWLNNYIRPADVVALARNGFNAIRLPLHYNLFTLPSEQEPVPGQNTWLTNGFKLVDDLLGWCETNHVYLILDMHACPGGQGYEKSISDYNPPSPSLWESSTNRAKLIALWAQIAARYATEPWIGGYDLINEPNWTFENNSDIHGCGDQSNAPLRQLFMDITSAIRQLDTNHLLFLEGNCYAGNYNGILPPWDDNLVISFHKYWDDPSAGSLQPWVDKRNQWNMPLWLGESGENSNEWFRNVVRYAELDNIGWSWWPWKKISTIAGPTMIQEAAGYKTIVNYWNNAGARPSTNDAFNGLVALAQAARYENCILHPDVIDALMRPNTAGITLPFTNHSVPGLIFAADYDMGSMGEAYFDQTTNSPYNSGNSYRNDSVDIEVCSDSPPNMGYDVGWLDTGDWMKYSVNMPTGPFGISARVASQPGGGHFHIEVAGSNLTGSISVPNTGGWQSWATVGPFIFTNALPADSFRFRVDSAGFNVSWFRFDSVLAAPPASLTATGSMTQASVNWIPSSGATGYNIKRSLTNGGPYTTIAPGITGTNFFDMAITNGVTYYYVVTAINSYGESTDSPQALATVPFPRLLLSASLSNVQISWPASASTMVLKSATNLSPPVSWSVITNAATNQGGTWNVLLPIERGTVFFKLSAQ